MVPLKLLDNEQMRDFIIDGFVVAKTDLPTEFHQDVYKRTQEIFENEGQPGNNLLALIPEVRAVFEDPSVVGALTAMLGHNYYMYPHRHVHFNQPGSPGQQLHIDSMTRRRHRTRWAMAMYYPQDTTENMGPTGILPRSHYYCNRDRKDPPWGNSQGGVQMAGDAGTVNIVHYDIFHRGTANRSQKDRFMMKFLFTRMEEPHSPSWDGDRSEWQGDGEDDVVWESQWDWHSGRQQSNAVSADIGGLVEHLSEAGTPASLHSAYTLGAMGETALPHLVPLLQDESETMRRNVSFALTSIGAPAVGDLVVALQDSSWSTRVTAAETITDIGLPAQNAISALIDALSDPSEAVRAHVAEALGTVSQNGPMAVLPLAKALTDGDVKVRKASVLSLCRIGSHANDAVPALRGVLNDEDRYVRGKAVHALHRIGSPVAQEILLDHLLTARWDHLTKAGSPY